MYGTVALAMIAVLGISMVSAFGMGPFGGHDLTDEEKAEMQEHREAVRMAVENGDYASWKSLMEERIARMQTELTEENFDRVVEKHAEMSEMREAMELAKETGDWSEVKALKENMDFEGHGKFKKGFRMGRHSDCPLAE
jgi:uncharacterized membrane protein (DUF106 family)